MARLNDKAYSLLEYAGIRSRSYSHSRAEISYDKDDPLPYYLNQARRAAYPGPYDAQGIPLYKYGAKLHHFSTLISMYGLGRFELYRKLSSRENLEGAVSVCDWLVSYQQVNGGWLIPFAVKKYKLGAPWVSSMAQGLGISLLARTSGATGNAEYLDSARRALGPFRAHYSEGGVVAYEGDRVFYDEYPSSANCHVLNGFIFALWGLLDLVRLARDREAQSLYDAGMATLVEYLPKFDTGYWSLYHISKGPQNPASLGYQRLHVDQMQTLYLITGETIFHRYYQLWQGYLEKHINALRTLPRKLIWNLIHGL